MSEKSPIRRSDLPASVRKQLDDLEVQVQRNGVAVVIWNNHFTVADRKELGDDVYLAWKHNGRTAGMWAAARGVSKDRAIVDIAYLFDWIDTKTCTKLLKATTARNYTRARRLLEEFFGKDRTLDSISEGDCDAYKRWLLDSYAPASASVDLRRARQFLKAAVRRRLIAVNPFAEVPCGPQVNDSRIVYVPAEDVERVIAACPDEDWRLVFALPRYAGSRFPSELQNLKWSDIDWQESRLTLREPKVEHHAGRGIRIVPISAELRPHLERAYRERAAGAVYVVPRARGGHNLGTQAKRIIEKAGVKPWPKLFVNMRGSCSDDLERRGIPEKAINAWIGNTARMRQRHYHSVRPEDWAAVTGIPAPIPAPPTPVSGHQEPSTLHDAREKSLDVAKDTETQYPRQGSNLRPTV